MTNERDEVFMATVALPDVLQHCLQVITFSTQSHCFIATS